MTKQNEFRLTGIVRETYWLEWVFLGILWIVTAACAYILSVNILLLPQLGPPYWPSTDTTLLQWMILALSHPFVWPAALATLLALALTIGVTVYFAVWLPSSVDNTIRLELSRIGTTIKRRLHRQYVTQINSKGQLVTRFLSKTAGSGEYGLVVLRATLPQASPDVLRTLAQRYFLAFDKVSLATVSSLDELHFKITQFARAFNDL